MSEFLDPLQALPALTKLALRTHHPLSHDAVNCSRRLSHLRHLDCPRCFTGQNLLHLVKGDAPVPPLEELPGDLQIDVHMLDIVRKFAPTLTAVRGGSALMSASLLPHLKAATTRDIQRPTH
jgi:hypothetical protein